MRRWLPLALAFAAAAPALPAEPVTPLPRAHAHNDYHQARPLEVALENGFCSVEADTFLVDGELLVAHDREDVTPDRTLRGLYLDPLRARVRANGGAVYPGGPEFLLLIDIKDEPEANYAALRALLAEYAEMITEFSDTEIVRRAVTVVISGNRPVETIAAEPRRLAGIDGRLPDLQRDLPPNLYPMISDNWNLHFRWRGVGVMPDAEREKLADLVARAHARGARLRFWALPRPERLWPVLHAAGVDLLNADDLPALRALLIRLGDG